MVMTTRLQERWANTCAVAGHNLAAMAVHGMGQGKSGFFPIRGMYSRLEHHGMMHFISFVVLDTFEDVVIPGSPALVDRLRGHYLTEVRTKLLPLPPNAFPPFFSARMFMFDRQEKLRVNPEKRTTLDKAREIVGSDGCDCEHAWNDHSWFNPEPCTDCKSVEVLLLRLGFVTCDGVSQAESRLMGDWCEETVHGGEPVPYSEPLDKNHIIMVKYMGDPN
jgi:hypothetical protein